jgi:hypothetical protein
MKRKDKKLTKPLQDGGTDDHNKTNKGKCWDATRPTSPQGGQVFRTIWNQFDHDISLGTFQLRFESVDAPLKSTG